MNKILAIVNLLLFGGMLYLNYLGGVGELNDVSTGEVSGVYPNLFTPAGFTFAIWSIIYLFNIAFVIYQLMKAFSTDAYYNTKLNIGFFLICLINSAWLVAWHHNALGVSMLLMILLLGLLIFSYQQSRTSALTFSYVTEYITFSIYLGWISVATIANSAIYLTYIGFTPDAILAATFAILVIVVALFLALYFLFKQSNPWFPLVILWASYGIYSARAIDPAVGAPMVKIAAMITIVILVGSIAYKRLLKA